MKIEFVTTDYELTYGHTPRGRGSWAFAPARNMDAVDPRIFWTPGSTTYTEAKKLARQHFTSQAPNVGGGWHRVWVCT